MDEFLTYEEQSIQLVNQKVKELRNKQIRLVKILWKHHGKEEATWELDDEMQKKYPELFANKDKEFRDQNSFKGERVRDSENYLCNLWFHLEFECVAISLLLFNLRAYLFLVIKRLEYTLN